MLLKNNRTLPSLTFLCLDDLRKGTLHLLRCVLFWGLYSVLSQREQLLQLFVDLHAVCDVTGVDLLALWASALYWHLKLSRSCLEDLSLKPLLQSNASFFSNKFETVFSA